MLRRSGLFMLILLLVSVAAQAAGAQSEAGRSVDVYLDEENPPAGLDRYRIVPGESSVSYAVEETFLRDSRLNVAVGVTKDVQGVVYVDPGDPANLKIGAITADISKFRSDNGRRDNAIRGRWLESARYPIAVFTPKTLRVSAETGRAGEGSEPLVEIQGELEVREVVRPVTFVGKLNNEKGKLTGTFETVVLMTDFGFEPPSIFGLLRAENEVKVTVTVVAQPAP